MEKVRLWLIPVSGSILCLTLAVVAVLAYHNGRIAIHNLNDMTTEGKQWFHSEHERATSPKNEAAIDAGIQAAAVVNGTFRGVNKLIIPRFMKLLDGGTQATLDFAAFTRHTDQQTNGQVLPAATAMIDSARDSLIALTQVENKFGVDADEAAKALRVAQEGYGLTLQEINKRLADPKFDQFIEKMNATMDEVHGTAVEVHAASRELPAIAVDVRKIGDASSRFTKAYWIAKIVSLFAVPYFP